jgi:hypothetical protein
MIVGIIAGTDSPVFIASTIAIILSGRKARAAMPAAAAAAAAPTTAPTGRSKQKKRAS